MENASTEQRSRPHEPHGLRRLWRTSAVLDQGRPADVFDTLSRSGVEAGPGRETGRSGRAHHSHPERWLLGPHRCYIGKGLRGGMSEPARVGLAPVVLDPSARLGIDASAAAEDDVAQRLAIWLAEVSAEAAPVSTPAAPPHSGPQRCGSAGPAR